MRHVPPNLCSFHTQKKHPMIPMVLPNHGVIFFADLEPPTDADPNLKWDAPIRMILPMMLGGKPTCKAKTIKTTVTIPPQTNSSALINGGWETTFLVGRPMFRGYVTCRIVTHQVR